MNQCFSFPPPQKEVYHPNESIRHIFLQIATYCSSCCTTSRFNKCPDYCPWVVPERHMFFTLVCFVAHWLSEWVAPFAGWALLGRCCLPLPCLGWHKARSRGEVERRMRFLGRPDSCWSPKANLAWELRQMRRTSRWPRALGKLPSPRWISRPPDVQEGLYKIFDNFIRCPLITTVALAKTRRIGS